MTELIIRQAAIEDMPQIVALVNSAYRGEGSRFGWTTEADLLEGIRTDAAEIAAILNAQDATILVGLMNNKIVASVHVQKNSDLALLGMFAVKPRAQGLGLGKQLLIAAECYVREEWQLNKIAMKVINVRRELLAFYERRGYLRTGEVLDFVLPPAMGRTKVANLKLEMLEKNL